MDVAQLCRCGTDLGSFAEHTYKQTLKLPNSQKAKRELASSLFLCFAQFCQFIILLLSVSLCTCQRDVTHARTHTRVRESTSTRVSVFTRFLLAFSLKACPVSQSLSTKTKRVRNFFWLILQRTYLSYCSHVNISAERKFIECPKAKTRVITAANKSREYLKEPMRTQCRTS